MYVKPKKHLGQHFLTDLSVAKRIADSLRADRCSTVLEVGCGTGVLTKFLLERTDITLYGAEVDPAGPGQHPLGPQLDLVGGEAQHHGPDAGENGGKDGAKDHQQEPAPDADTATLCEHASALFMTAINGTQNALSPQAVDQAVALLHSARQVFCMGTMTTVWS